MAEASGCGLLPWQQGTDAPVIKQKWCKAKTINKGGLYRRKIRFEKSVPGIDM